MKMNILKSIFSLSVIISIFFLLSIESKAVYEPCEPEEPISKFCETIGYSGMMIELFNCQSIDPLEEPCSIEVEYCVRKYLVGGVNEYRIEIKSIKLKNCNSECNQHIWKGAVVIMALNHDIPGSWDIYDMIYQAATCWKPLPISPIYNNSHFGYESCSEGECCVGFYHISREYDENGDKEITVEFASRMTRMTHYCTPPCTFTDCESTIPNFGPIEFTDNGTGIYYPKLSSPEIILSNDIKLIPNPVTDKLDLNITRNNNSSLTIKIYDNNGLLVYDNLINAISGESNFNINTSNYNSGIYNVVIFNNSEILLNRSFIKIK